jgi:hypothetical protein
MPQQVELTTATITAMYMNDADTSEAAGTETTSTNPSHTNKNINIDEKLTQMWCVQEQT